MDIESDFVLNKCKSCFVQHYDNCPECFGFGMIISEDERRIPLSSDRAYYFLVAVGKESNLEACNFCKSTISGLPQVA